MSFVRRMMHCLLALALVAGGLAAPVHPAAAAAPMAMEHDAGAPCHGAAATQADEDVGAPMSDDCCAGDGACTCDCLHAPAQALLLRPVPGAVAGRLAPVPAPVTARRTAPDWPEPRPPIA